MKEKNMDYYNKIKKELIENEIYKRVKDYSKNKYELERYYNVGKLLIEAQGGEARAKYGDGLIKEYSRKLTIELGKGYSTRSLKYMRKFYLYQKGHPLGAQLSWSHYKILLSLKDDRKIYYYLHLAREYNLSKRELSTKIKSNEYERLDQITIEKLLKKEDFSISDNIKHPIIIKNKFDTIDISEKMLKQLILEDIDNFLCELGKGFSYIKNEYKIKIGDRYNYVDLLLFNYKYNAFVVVELKVTELKKEHIGQIQIYMNYIDKNIKSIKQEKTIGIIVARENNKFVLEYSSDKRIYQTTYLLVKSN
jgi:predicted nuclease of restriction endonuclease-like (RecB) superfamily